jgi:TPR repeat protein
MPNQIADGIKNMDINSNGRQGTMSPLTSQYPHPSSTNDTPHLSPFPKLVNPPPNVPPSDDELELTLESARPVVLNSNDPEMQLAWAADALIYVGVCADNEERIAAAKPHAARSATPRVEHQLKEDAMNIVTFLADQHHPKAEFLRGMWLEWGRFGQREDKKEAFRCYSRAADKQYARAEYRIGMLYESYNDPVKALRHYHRGVDAGDAASCYRLGMMTLRGQHGQQQDFARGIELIKKSAEAADENAAQGAYVYGMLLARQLPQIEVPDRFLDLDERKARMNIEKAAYLKFAKAQLKMGSAYELGSLGCEFNPALSVHYNALASKQGEAEADMSLSKWFLVGSEGLFPKNEELAYTYAERAAQSGLATAEFALGYFSEIGMYVPVDLDKALEWYQKASKHGNADAAGRIEGLSRKQVLSRKDHEQVAVSRIKSQHGSMRGVRPERFQQQPRPSRLGQSTTIDEEPQTYSNGNAGGIQAPPPRGSSITPYPEDDRPLKIPHDNKPQSVAPYPLEDGPPTQPRLGPAGGFFNVSQPPRPSTTLNPDVRPSSAFQINPDLRPNSIAQPPYAGRPNYYGGAPPPGARPATTQPYDARLRPPPQAKRVASGPPGMQNYPPNQSTPSPAPQRPPMPQQASSPAVPQQAPAKIDIGFSAPFDDRRNRQYGPQRPNQPPSSQAPALQSSQTMPVDKPAPLAPSTKPSKPPDGKKPDARLPTKESAAKPPAKASTMPAKPPGKGPKTFDEMGVPAQQKDGECVSLSSFVPSVLSILTANRLSCELSTRLVQSELILWRIALMRTCCIVA